MSDTVPPVFPELDQPPQEDLRPGSFRLLSGVATDVGKVRKENEDSHLALPQSGLWVVADGMGGYTAGRLASSTVVETLATVGPSAPIREFIVRLEDRVRLANSRLREIGVERGLGTFGTTVVALMIHGRGFGCAWCGDSRAYLVRDGEITQITRDHTEVQELVDRGQLTREEAKRWPGRNIITRAIGVFDDPDLEAREGQIKHADCFVLCSDGLTAHISDEEIRDIVDGAAPQVACDELVRLTLARGAVDNVTVAVVACLEDEPTVRT